MFSEATIVRRIILFALGAIIGALIYHLIVHRFSTDIEKTVRKHHKTLTPNVKMGAAYVRDGASQLAESIEALRKLYAQNQDAKVRADLIALLVRQGNGAEALRVRQLQADRYSVDELQKFGQKPPAIANSSAKLNNLYRPATTRSQPENRLFSAGALTAVDAKEYAAAKNKSPNINAALVIDEDIQLAERYPERAIAALPSA